MRSRRLSGLLKQYRRTAGLDQAAVAAYIGHHKVWVSRVETPEWCRPSVGDVRALLTLYGVTAPDEADRVVRLAMEVRQPGWWQEFGLSEAHATFVALEAEAAGKRAWEKGFIPGLLQTEDYARAVIAAGPDDLDPGRVERLVRVRMERKKALHRPAPLRLHAVIGEAVLACPAGGRDVMAAQLRHLADAAAEPNVTVQVLPFAAGAHPGLSGSFTILEYPDPDDHDVLYCDTLAGAVYAEGPRDIARAYRVFSHLIAVSLSPHASIDLAAKYAASL